MFRAFVFGFLDRLLIHTYILRVVIVGYFSLLFYSDNNDKTTHHTRRRNYVAPPNQGAPGAVHYCYEYAGIGFTVNNRGRAFGLYRVHIPSRRILANSYTRYQTVNYVKNAAQSTNQTSSERSGNQASEIRELDLTRCRALAVEDRGYIHLDMETDRRGVAAQRRTPNAIPTFVGPLVRSRHTKPCPIYFEVSFLDNKPQTESPRRLDAIVFRNFYCSHITIKRRRPRRQPQLDTKLDGKQERGATRSGGIDDEPWVTILRDRPLMEDPHYEDDAQFWHVVTREEFDQEECDAESTEPLRIYVYQPSPLWKTFGLQHVKCVCWSASSAVAPIGEEQTDDSTNSTQNNSSGAREGGGGNTAGANLGELCRGISEQVQIFGDRRRVRRLT